MRRILVTSAVLAGSLGATAQAAERDVPPPFPVDTGPAPWQQPFSVVAGGGTRRPAEGMVAGLADLGRVWSGARDGTGRVVVVTTTGTWIVRTDGRLTRLRGLTPAPKPRNRYVVVLPPGPRAVASLPDGRVAIADVAGDRVVALAPGADAAVPLATTEKPVEALGLDRDGSLLGVADGRVLRLRAGGLRPGERLSAGSYAFVESRGIGAVPSGLLALQGGSDVLGGDEGALVTLGAEGRPRTAYAPPSTSSPRSLAVLPDGRALLATNAFSSGDLDDRPIALAAGRTLDRQSFDYGVGEEYYGWISRRRTLLRLADGSLRRIRWAGPPADAITPDGPTDVLVASAGRLWSTRPGLGAPELGDFWGRRVGVRLGAPATVTVSARTQGGEVSVSTTPTPLPAGRTFVTLPPPGPGLNRVTVTARTAAGTTVTGTYAFDPGAFSPKEADRVLSAVARRLNIGFEGALSHGVDRCRTITRTWSNADGRPAASSGRAPTQRGRSASRSRPGAMRSSAGGRSRARRAVATATSSERPSTPRPEHYTSSSASSLPCSRSRPRCTAAMNFERLTSSVLRISSA